MSNIINRKITRKIMKAIESTSEPMMMKDLYRLLYKDLYSLTDLSNALKYLLFIERIRMVYIDGKPGYTKACKATDPCDLEGQILDPNIVKNEAMWWARRRIIELEEEAKKAEQFITANDIHIGKLSARLELLEENALADAITIDTLKEELRNISAALDDPRVDVTITMVDRIKELQERKGRKND